MVCSHDLVLPGAGVVAAAVTMTLSSVATPINNNNTEYWISGLYVCWWSVHTCCMSHAEGLTETYISNMLLVLQIKLCCISSGGPWKSSSAHNLRQVFGCENQPTSDGSVDSRLSRTWFSLPALPASCASPSTTHLSASSSLLCSSFSFWFS